METSRAFLKRWVFCLIGLALVPVLSSCKKHPSASPTSTTATCVDPGGGGGSGALVSTPSAFTGYRSACASGRGTVSGTLHRWSVDGEDPETRRFSFAEQDWLVDDSGERYEVPSDSFPPSALTGDRIEVRGDDADSCIATIDRVAASETSRSAVTGPISVAVILVSFSGKPNTQSVADVNDRIFNQVNAYYNEASYGALSVTGQVFGPYTLPTEPADCPTPSTFDDAEAAAQAAGVNLSAYSHVMIYTPTLSNCNYAGLGEIGGTKTFVGAYTDMSIPAHELGHNLGLMHGHSYFCGCSPIGTSCTSTEYGDFADIMGFSNTGHFNAFHKEQLGWISTAAGSLQKVSTAGQFTLLPYESATAGLKALEVYRSIDPTTGHTFSYYVEYRQSVGFDAYFTGDLSTQNITAGGVLIHLATTQDVNSSELLNQNPTSSNALHSGLSPGQTFTDSTNHVSIALVSADASGAVVQVSYSQ